VAAKAKAEAPKQYRVLVGMNYPPDNTRAEEGDVVDNLPPYAVQKLLNAMLIEEVD
jgi:hypothetical protein